MRKSGFKVSDKMPQKRNILLWSVLILGVTLCFMASIYVGSMKISIAETFRILLSKSYSDAAVVLWEIRLPRAILGVLVGASLGLAGAGMQGLLRNPLAEPGVMGVTGGAVFGAVLVFYTGISSIWPIALPMGGMAGALVSVIVLYLLAGYMPSVQTMILAGVALNTLAFAGTSLALNLSPNPYASLEIVFWQMGSLADRSFMHVALAAPFILIGAVMILWDRRALDALSLGEETAVSLGIPLRTVQFRQILGTALAVGAAVSVCGSIGFVGLVVPHLLRPFVGQEPGKLLGVSALGGAVLILLADIIVRLVPIGAELKLGVLTSLIGAPFFIALIFKMRRGLT
ncbi:MAG: iron ABC transporter permease [Candidatus Omnitrophica bacterium]|nr:iron ABC transporter permease [Candidatus Omnitrophota bacterium]MDD5672510.1 iron ABC transporter permease [Candidatus Omnitrophota bacterium]